MDMRMMGLGAIPILGDAKPADVAQGKRFMSAGSPLLKTGTYVAPSPKPNITTVMSNISPHTNANLFPMGAFFTVNSPGPGSTTASCMVELSPSGDNRRMPILGLTDYLRITRSSTNLTVKIVIGPKGLIVNDPTNIDRLLSEPLLLEPFQSDWVTEATVYQLSMSTVGDDTKMKLVFQRNTTDIVTISSIAKWYDERNPAIYILVTNNGTQAAGQVSVTNISTYIVSEDVIS